MRFRASRILIGAASLASALLLAASGQVRAEESNSCFTGDGSIKEVLDACEAYINSGSTDNDRLIKAHSIRAMGLSATGDFDGAVSEMDTAINIDATKPNNYFMRAAAYAAKKDYDKAITDLDKAIEMDAKHGDFFLLRGIVYRRKGQPTDGNADLSLAQKLEPGIFDKIRKLGVE